MRPKTSSRPKDDLWSQPASVQAAIPAPDKPPPQGTLGEKELNEAIERLVEPYQSKVNARTLSKTVK